MTFGKTQLIKLSPKKTVEGFVGAFFSTLIFGVAVSILTQSMRTLNQYHHYLVGDLVYEIQLHDLPCN